MTDTARLSRAVLPIRLRPPRRDRRRRDPVLGPGHDRSGGHGGDPDHRPPRQGPRRRAGRPHPGRQAAGGATRCRPGRRAHHRPDRASAQRGARTGGAALRRAGQPGLLGYYRSTYVDETGAERVLAATQFEAPHARRAFPCFDEPEFKANFSITLVVADGLLAISNGPEIGRESLGDGRARAASRTIPMSTYLVAWVVGPLELTEPVDAGGVALRVAHVPAGTSHPLRARRRLVRDPVLRRLLRHPVSRREVRSRRAPRLLVRRDGEPRVRHVPRGAAAPRSRSGDAHRDVRRRAHDRARDRAHVVRRSRDHEVVERHLAQRGVRDVHGAPRRRRVQRGVEDVGRLRARARRARRRRALQHAHRRVRGDHARRRRRHVRPAHVPKGWIGPAHGRALARRRRVPCRRAPLSRPLPAREHRDHRPVGLAGVGDERARAPDHGLVDLPTRLPARGAPRRDGRLHHDHPTTPFAYDHCFGTRAVGDPRSLRIQGAPFAADLFVAARR